jgi:hypothetical protein
MRLETVTFYLDRATLAQLNVRARSLGYPTRTAFFRELLRTELEEPRVRDARLVLGPPRYALVRTPK